MSGEPANIDLRDVGYGPHNDQTGVRHEGRFALQ